MTEFEKRIEKEKTKFETDVIWVIKMATDIITDESFDEALKLSMITGVAEELKLIVDDEWDRV